MEKMNSIGGKLKGRDEAHFISAYLLKRGRIKMLQQKRRMVLGVLPLLWVIHEP